MRNNTLKVVLSLMMMSIFSFTFAQVTTSSMRGDVLDSNFSPVAGASVEVKHEPTGTMYSATTDENGSFYIGRMRVGGPYTVVISGADFESTQQGDIYLQLGQTYSFYGEVAGSEDVIELDGIVATATKNNTFNRGRTGAETVFDTEDLQTLPNVTGGIADFVRVTPQARVEEDNTISIAGQNNRYNAIYVDGGVDNDVFGLSDSGLDGGGSGGTPFALDELDQVTVSSAPFDVRQSGFAGGAINAITRSGSNEWHGSAYWLARNETLMGRTAEYDESQRRGLAEFNADRYGFSIGGPIMKDKLFFFATYEKELIETPAPFDETTYIGDALASGDIDNFYSVLENNFGYNPGGFGSALNSIDKDLFATRIDWNINNNHSLSFKYKYINVENFDAAVSNSGNLNFNDRSILRPNTKNQFALDWNANWTDKLSSKVLVNYKTVRDDRDPNGLFPTISIEDGAGNINFGAEQFSTANNLEQDVLSVIGNLEYNLGDHNIVFGTQFENYDMLNIFIRRNYGAYAWDNDDVSGLTGLQRFLAGENPDFFRRQFSLIDGDTVGDNNAGAAADFTASQLAFYLQDEWRVNNDLKLTAGVRVDLPFYEDTRLNEDFNNNAIPLLEAAGRNLRGARTGSSINTTPHFSPRLGFNYTPDIIAGYKTQFRGGVGVFTSRIPLVWVGGAYNNTGNTIGEINDFSGTTPFNPDIASNNGFSPADSRPQIDLFDEDFKLPQRLKVSFGLDQELPEGFNFTLDYQYDDVLNDVLYENLNISQVGRFTGADDRIRWAPFFDGGSVLDNYGEVLLGTNTDEGYAHTITLGLNKEFFNKLYVGATYTYNDAYSINNGTSSQNSSQWNNLPSVNGKNVAELARSDYAMGSRVTGLVSYTQEWGSESKSRTKVSLFYEGIDGAPYSYVYGEGRSASTRLLYDDASARDATLLYVPRDISEINLVDGYRGQTVQQQWDALNSFIESDPYLSSRRGQYAERNENRMPWTNVVDLRFLQEFDIQVNGKPHTIGFSFDIFNFTNLINKDWGRRYTNGVFRGWQLVDVVDVVDNGDGTFTANYGVNPSALDREAIESFDNSGIQSSIWQMQFGVKYTF